MLYGLCQHKPFFVFAHLGFGCKPRLITGLLFFIWTVQVSVPEKLIGGPVANNRRVQILKVFFANRWSDTKKQSGRHLFLYDPTMFYKWISKKYKTITDTDTMYKDKLGIAYGFTINCSNIPPPDEPIWRSGDLIIK